MQAESSSPSDPSRQPAEQGKPVADEATAAFGTNQVGMSVAALAEELDFIAQGLSADPPLVRPAECAEMLIGIAANLRSVAQDAGG